MSDTDGRGCAVEGGEQKIADDEPAWGVAWPGSR